MNAMNEGPICCFHLMSVSLCAEDKSIRQVWKRNANSSKKKRSKLQTSDLTCIFPATVQTLLIKISFSKMDKDRLMGQLNSWELHSTNAKKVEVMDFKYGTQFCMSDSIYLLPTLAKMHRRN